MSEPIKVGGSFTCGRCGEQCSGADVHFCEVSTNGFDPHDPLNIGYNDGWNDAIKQAVKIVNDARTEGRELREIRDELKTLLVETETK